LPFTAQRNSFGALSEEGQEESPEELQATEQRNVEMMKLLNQHQPHLAQANQRASAAAAAAVPPPRSGAASAAAAPANNWDEFEPDYEEEVFGTSSSNLVDWT